jgi:pyruvate,water dikinase
MSQSSGLTLRSSLKRLGQGRSEVSPNSQLVISLSRTSLADVALVGGKNASLGELIQNMTPLGMAVPEGFATTSAAYWAFIDANGLRAKIMDQLKKYSQGKKSLSQTGQKIRRLIRAGRMPDPLIAEIFNAYRDMCSHADKKTPPSQYAAAQRQKIYRRQVLLGS